MKSSFKTLLCLTGFILFSTQSNAQELFVFSAPASNMPAKSIGFTASQWINYDSNMYQTLPEMMISFNKKLMIHLDGNLSNRFGNYSLNGGSVYAKYRFYTIDKIKNHFRMASYMRISRNKGKIDQEEINVAMRNSGVETGLIATQLIHKTAISASVSFNHLFYDKYYFEKPETYGNKALNYSLSFGRLILPKKYKNYKQVNMNIMLELLGQQTFNGKSFLDAAPSVQFIFNSQTKIDVGYKRQIQGNMTRYSPNAFLIKIEHLLFNAF